MIQTANGEIELKKDRRTILVYGLALVLALAAFLVIHRIGDVTKFASGTEIVYEGVVSDRAYSTVDQNDRWAENREYLGLSLANPELDGICIWAASDKAPDRKKHSFPQDVKVGDLVRVTAAEEVGTGLMVVLDAEVVSHRDDFLNQVSMELRLHELPAASSYTSSDDHTVTSITYDGTGADIIHKLLHHETDRSYLWRPLPLSQNLSEALYGHNSRLSSEASALLPEIKNGWWFLKGSDESSYDDRKPYSLVSSNFTAAIYDADTDTLYYIEIDK